jgi:beta-mannosidase
MLHFGKKIIAIGFITLRYPRGYGSQPLYDLEVKFVSQTLHEDVVTKRIGFRKVELVTNFISLVPRVREFYFRINGIPIFSKGM